MFKLTIVTPEKRILVGQEVDEVTVPAFKGELNILPGHAPLITTLETGVMKWKIKGKERQELAVISWGYCQVSPEGVNILANIADLPEEIDVEATKAYLAESEKKVMNELISDEDWVEFQREWARSRAKIEVVTAQGKK
ncbi:MAG: ATP synthase F1 subunit epsilon [Bdellovibrio sp.]|nr:ATP synthase F1 subunit epsilon [Bdellovibrio sp.]